jgi:hypothetical protein
MPARTLPAVAPAMTSAEPEADATYHVPAHGHGRLRPFRPGQSGNPSGTSGRYGEVVRLCQNASPEIAKALIGIALDPSEDARARIVACQEILGRAFGRIKAEVKDVTEEPARLDASKLTDRELEVLLKIARAARPDGSTPQ